jgi:hypothetical protein
MPGYLIDALDGWPSPRSITPEIHRTEARELPNGLLDLEHPGWVETSAYGKWHTWHLRPIMGAKPPSAMTENEGFNGPNSVTLGCFWHPPFAQQTILISGLD